MTNQNEEAIKTLNDLIEYAKDGQHGYHTAAEDVDNTQLKSMFQNYAQQRAQFVNELKQEVRNLGGDPDKKGSVTGTIHRAWIDLKSAVSSGDEKAILAECDRGDSAAEEAYDKALRASLPPSTLGTVRQQHNEVRAARNEIRSLRDRYEK